MLDAMPDAAPGAGFAWTVLPRHGRRPLGFEGRLLVQAASRPPALPVWSELAVHETSRGALVASIRHRTPDEAEPGPALLADAEARADAAALIEWLRHHDPVAHLPAALLLEGGADPADALRIVAALRADWRALLAATFGGLSGPGQAAADPNPDPEPGEQP